MAMSDPFPSDPNVDDQNPKSLLGVDPEGETYHAIRRRGLLRRWSIFVWILIAIPAGLLVTNNVLHARAMQQAPPTPPEASDQAPVELVARILVGVQHWVITAGGAQPELVAQMAQASRDSVDPEATPAGDMVRMASVAGEMDGPETALDLLYTAEAALDGPTKNTTARGHLKLLLAAQTERQYPEANSEAELLELTVMEEREALRAMHTTAPPDGETYATGEHAKELQTYADGLRRDISMLRRIYEDGNASDVDAAEQQRLVERHGYFGHLALAHGATSPDAHRDVVVQESRRTFFVFFAAIAIGLTALLMGFVLFIVAVVLLTKKRIKLRLAWQVRDIREHRHVFLETMAVFLWGFLGISFLIGWLTPHVTIDPGPLLIWALLPIALWPALRGVQGRTLIMGLGWHANGTGIRGIFKEILCGIIGYLALLPIFLLGAAIMFLLMRWSGAQPEHPITQEIDTSLGGVALLLLMVSVWAPIVEETMFRGALFSHTRTFLPSIAAAMVVGFLFAAIHPQGWAAIPPLMSLGIIFALIREWRGSLIGSMTAHALHNGFLMTMMSLALSG